MTNEAQGRGAENAGAGCAAGEGIMLADAEASTLCVVWVCVIVGMVIALFVTRKVR